MRGRRRVKSPRGRVRTSRGYISRGYEVGLVAVRVAVRVVREPRHAFAGRVGGTVREVPLVGWFEVWVQHLELGRGGKSVDCAPMC